MTRILLVDDTRLFLELERSFLRRTGCDTFLAGSGEEALRKIRDLKPDLVVLDARMPVMDGLDCCRELRADPATKDLPLVLVSGPEDYTACMEAGADAFVPKPLRREALLEAVGQIVTLAERAFDRAAVDLKVDFLAGERKGSGHTKDLCVGGMFLRTREPIAEGAEVRVDFDVPGPEAGPVSAGGVVVRQVPADHDSHLIPGVGVTFKEISARDRMRISRFVRSETEDE